MRGWATAVLRPLPLFFSRTKLCPNALGKCLNLSIYQFLSLSIRLQDAEYVKILGRPGGDFDALHEESGGWEHRYIEYI